MQSGSCAGALCTESLGANANLPSADLLAAMEAAHKEVSLSQSQRPVRG